MAQYSVILRRTHAAIRFLSLHPFRTDSTFEEAGFTIEELVELEGYHGTLSYEMDVARRSLPLRPSHYGGGALGIVATVFGIVLVPLCHLLSQFYARLDRRVKYTERGHCKNYCVVARKRV